MNTELIETFLTVAETENITEAAAQLYVSQGTTSTRIHQLEDELGVTLFVRQRGVKKVAITPEGEVFHTLARQWVGLEQEAQNIKKLLAYRELRIAAVDTINTFTFAELYPRYTQEHPRTKLYIQTEHSTEIHHLIEEQAIDIGFAFTLHKSKVVYSKPLYKEDMVILCHKDSPFAKSNDLRDLKETHEVRANVSPDFSIWHKRRFPSYTNRYVTIGTASMLPQFMSNTENWSILAQSVANEFAKRDPGLVVVPFEKDPPPARIAYLLYYRYPRPWVEQMCEEFLASVTELVKDNPAFELY